MAEHNVFTVISHHTAGTLEKHQHKMKKKYVVTIETIIVSIRIRTLIIGGKVNREMAVFCPAYDKRKALNEMLTGTPD